MDFIDLTDSSVDNLPLIEELHEKYKENPLNLDSSWRKYFASMDERMVATPTQPHFVAPSTKVPNDLRIFNLIEAYRTYGHLEAKINPIETHLNEEPWQLKLETLGFSKNELDQPFPTCGLLPHEMAPLKEIINTLKSIYCDKIGVEYMGLQNPDLEKWLQEHIEPSRFKISLNIEQKKMILQHLNRSELFESFLHTKHTGQKRFSLEGGETLIPIIEAIVETGSKLGMEEFVLGMAHRGRLNVLSNILKKSYSNIFSEFEEGYIPNSFEGSGDVKYHKGFSSEVKMPNGTSVKIFLAPNPSHLEAVDPVVEGQVRARQALRGDTQHEKVVPILVHGDAALAGQGVVYETMQLYNLPGYRTGGTIHLVINNQIGFTATPNETRSTRYCTDIAKAFSAPVFHVNAEDPEGCVYATILAVEIRHRFHCDVFIDLNCYRKYGHNEADEPAFTQPLEYQLIRKKKPIREVYRDDLIHQGVVEKHLAEALEEEFTQALHQAMKETKASMQQTAESKEIPTTPSQNKPMAPVKTGVTKKVLCEVAKKMFSVPEGFNINPKLRHLVQERLSMVCEEKKPIDWGTAELLAYGTLLWDGFHVRVSGQDSRRGTFSHRHAIWMDQQIEKAYSPLNHLKPQQGKFEVVNSPLSEYAVLGFEFGYSFAYNNALVIWEAQFGDFCNGAQIMIDQFIATAEQKWGQKFGLVMFLPHGYEGQGPEHSSGRMERFLALSAEANMRVVNPTTPAQFFHLLRKQVLDPVRKPLVVFTPKGLLRYSECVSTLRDMSDGTFQPILEDAVDNPSKVKRLVLCSGRIYYDLKLEKEKTNDMTIIRLEQLYPLDTDKIADIARSFKSLKECIWVQEEPSNMGAWDFLRPQLRDLLPKQAELKYVGRQRSASPATGSHAIHKKQHAMILKGLFG